MKIRIGFVSNSSSSSFVCDVCGEEVSGMDMGLDEAEMFNCVNGHEFCESHGSKISTQKKKNMILNEIKDFDEEEKNEILERIKEDEIKDIFEEVFEDYRYEVPAKQCPICQYKEYKSEEALKFLMKKNNISKKELLKDMKEMYPEYKEMQKYIEDKK